MEDERSKWKEDLPIGRSLVIVERPYACERERLRVIKNENTGLLFRIFRGRPMVLMRYHGTMLAPKIPDMPKPICRFRIASAVAFENERGIPKLMHEPRL